MPCVLCIDDNKDVLASVADVLRNCGYSTLIAGSGAEGLGLLRTASVDVVVLDYEMPNMDGDVVAQAIRRHKPTALDLPGPITLQAGLKSERWSGRLKLNAKRRDAFSAA